jgi:HemY protein
MLAAPSPRRDQKESEGLAEPPREVAQLDAAAPPATQDNLPPATKVEQAAAPSAASAPASSPPLESSPPAPLFRSRVDLSKPAQPPIPPVIPILRPPDDPGVDDEAPSDEFTEQVGTPKAQAGGWRGFLARWGA